jgi:hypothetical protein
MELELGDEDNMSQQLESCSVSEGLSESLMVKLFDDDEVCSKRKKGKSNQSDYNNQKK